MYALRQVTRMSLRLSRNLPRAMATGTTPASQAISEAAKAEGGPQKGSLSASMQSQVGRTQNFEQAAAEVGQKIQDAPETVTSEDAAYLKSREAKATQQAQPPSDSLSAEAQRIASVNEGATKTSNIQASNNGPSDPAEQSASDRLENFEAVASEIAAKMAKDPSSVTKEEADLLHSREQRAFGSTSKSGIASQAQSLASGNQKS